MGVARRTVRHHPVGVKSYTRRYHPVIYVDVRLRRWESAGHPGSSHTNCRLQPFSAGPATQASRPDRDWEGGDLWHLPWERPGPLTEALARSERAAGRRTLPRPAA